MKSPQLARFVLPVVMASLLLSQGNGALAGDGALPRKASAAGERASAEGVDGSREVRRQPLGYEAYVRLVARRGIAGHGGHKGRRVKTVKEARKTKAPEKPVAVARAVEAPSAAATAPVAVFPRGNGWRPGIDEVREILRSTRDLAGANLRAMNLAGLDLREATFAGADLYMTNLDGAVLDGANLRGASLEMATLRGASLRGAKLAGAGLFKANLEGANLEGADLTGVYAVCVNLRGAQLASTIMRGGSFTRAIIGTDQAVAKGPVAEEGIREGVAEGSRDVAPPAEEWRVAFLEH